MAYRYEPLSQDYHTRVIDLYPACDPNTPLRGSIRCVNLDVDPLYDAISYTWGDPIFTEDIIIDGGFNLRITPNLRDALTRLRHPIETHSVWADAMCINQEDEEDNRKQIPLMADIFRCASSVLVWLGNSPIGEACLHKIAVLSQRKTVAATASNMDEISSIFEELFTLPWFRRRWVIQEVVFNPNVTFLCGRASVAWLRMTQLLRLIPEDISSPPTLHLHALKRIWDTRGCTVLPRQDSYQYQAFGILDLLTISETGCSDGRDRIYALAGLANDVIFGEKATLLQKNKIPLCIDYTKSVEQVYLDFAVAVGNSKIPSKMQQFLLKAV